MNTRILFAAAALFAVTAVWSAAPVYAQIGGGDDGGSGGDDGGSGGDDSGSGSGGGGSGVGSGAGSGDDVASGDDAGFDLQTREPGDFVGADSSDNLSVRGGTDDDAGGGGANQGLGGFFNQLFGQGGVGGQQTQRNQPTTGRVRVRLTPSIEYFGAGDVNVHAARMAERQAAILPRYSENPHVGSIAGVQMFVEDRVAVITGTVATERQKNLIGGMLELEPGISSVDNRLIVAPAATLPAASLRDSASTRAFSAAPN